MTISILVCTIPSRYAMWGKLQTEFWRQALPYAGEIELLYDNRISVSVGEKRNDLKKRATGKYLMYHDDDDFPAPNYIELLMKAAETDCDCASLKGVITYDGQRAEIFEHSLKYKAWKTNPNGAEIKHERFPNHLNMIRSEIAKQFDFPEKSHGEDYDWSTLVHNSGLLKTEYYIPDVIYYYNFIQHKSIKMAYSQGAEESFIVDFYKEKANGNFLDIGAYDIFRFSNTRKLYELGWSGKLIEPSPPNYKSIADHYAGNPRIEVLNFAVGEPSGEVVFYESNGDAVGTTSKEHMEKWQKGGVNFNEIKVTQVGVADFFNQYGHGIDFLSIDTEATNIELFRHIPEWVFEEISLLCIEHDGHHEEIEEKLRKFGFSNLYMNAENILLGKNGN